MRPTTSRIRRAATLVRPLSPRATESVRIGGDTLQRSVAVSLPLVPRTPGLSTAFDRRQRWTARRADGRPRTMIDTTCLQERKMFLTAWQIAAQEPDAGRIPHPEGSHHEGHDR